VSPLEAQLVSLAIGLGATLLIGWLRGTLGGRGLQRRAAERFGRRAGLPVGDPPDRGLVRRVVRRQRFVLGGAAAGIVAGSSMDALWLGGLYCGLAVGAVADRLTQPAAAPGTPRVAHATSIRVTDYVPSWLLAAVAAAAAAVPTLAVLWVIAPRTERNLGNPELRGGVVLGLVLLALAALVASLWLARLIVGRRATAGSPTELAVDDALRAQAVRDALHLSAATSVLCVFTLSYSLAEQDVDGALRRVGGWLPLGVLVALAVVGTVHEVRGPRHWRARLHPELERAGAGSA
jgi:hypothetical protein